MKKSLLSILSLVLLLVSIPSLAAQKQIQFLDNKWGSSCPEVLKLLRKKNVYATGLGQYWDTTVESIIGYSQSDKYELVTTYSAFAFPSSGKTQGFELEGYDMDSIEVFFSYSALERSEDIFADKNTRLFMARYNKSFDDLEEYSDTIDGLSSKLNSKYGDSHFERRKGTVTDEVWYLWCDNYGNGLILFGAIVENQYAYIDLSYIWANANDAIHDSYDFEMKRMQAGKKQVYYELNSIINQFFVQYNEVATYKIDATMIEKGNIKEKALVYAEKYNLEVVYVDDDTLAISIGTTPHYEDDVLYTVFCDCLKATYDNIEDNMLLSTWKALHKSGYMVENYDFDGIIITYVPSKKLSWGTTNPRIDLLLKVNSVE